MKKVLFTFAVSFMVGLTCTSYAQEGTPAPEETVQDKCTIEKKTVQDMIDGYLSSKGWTAGLNTKNGKKFFVATGTGVVQAPRDSASYIPSRVNAFNKSMLDAKKSMIEFLGTEISTETAKSYSEGDFGAQDDNKQQAEEDPNSMAYKIKKLIHAKLDKALRDEGIDPQAADKAAAERAAKKLLNSEKYAKMIKTMAQAEVIGLQAICTFEGTPSNDKGEIGVVAIWSPKLQEMAASILTGRPVASGKAKKPIIEQIATDPGALLSTFGVQQKIDENGDLVIVGFGQAGGVSESKMSAKGAQSKAKANALAAIREFAGENVAVATDTLNAETTEEFENAAEEYQDTSAFSEKIKTTATKLNITGIAVLKNWSFKHPLNGRIAYGCICTWSPKSANAARQVKAMMANPTSTTGANGSVNKTTPHASAQEYQAGGQNGDDDAF